MNLRSERGAIIIQVAVALLGLTLFSAFVLDQGIMYAARREAQTSADAAALTGMIALTFDNDTQAGVQAKARGVGLTNTVWGAAPDIQTSDIQFIPCPPAVGLPTGDTCIKADAYRTIARNNPLPTFFAQLAGITQQEARATATARAVAANAATCLRPWVVGDKWFDTQPGGWDQTATFDPSAGDYYTPPTPTDPGTGFSAKDANGNPTYYGYQFILKLANPGSGGNNIPIESAGWAMEICLDNPNDANPCNTPAYVDNIEGCTSDLVKISPPGETCTVVDPSVGCLAVKTGSTGNNNAKAVADFITNHDPGASWADGGGAAPWQTGTIVNTTQSPSSRIVPIALVDIPDYINAGYNGSNGIVRVVNIMGFFVEGTCDTVSLKESYLQCPSGGNGKSAIVGRMVNYTGVRAGSGGPTTGNFGQVIILTR
jgi:hypothetical protein